MKKLVLVPFLLVTACKNDVLLNEHDQGEPGAREDEPSSPDDPDGPDDPDDPDDPTDPDDPSDPADPSDPDDPGDPSDPSDPTDPDDPSDPSDPSDPPPSACSYPQAGSLNGVGSVMPKLVWSDARHADGSTFAFDLEDFHCNDATHDAIVFILSAEWCGNCAAYIQDIAQQAAAIESAGGLLVFLDLQTSSYSAPSNARAHQYITGYIGNDAGIRVGDGGSDQPGFIYNSSIWSAVPGGFVVKKSDMKVIANQEESSSVLDYAEIVGGIGGGGGGSGGGGGTSGCVEEASEPNNGSSSAPTIQAGAFAGGVCDAQPDYFRIPLSGSWRIDLDFSHARGDLDMEVVGTNVRSDSGDDDESLTHSGSAVLKVYGWSGATNSYTLTLTAL